MEFEHKISINASAANIFAIYENVDAWSSWDPDVKSASIDGLFEAGAMGKLKPINGPESKILLTEVVKDKLFTVTSRLPLCKMTFEHVLEPNGKDTAVLHKVSFTGLLSPIFGRLIGTGISKGLPYTLRELKLAAESGCKDVS